MSRDQRRAPRRPVTFAVSVHDDMTGQVAGHVVNLSESGMLLLAVAPLAEDALYQLRFPIPGTTEDEIMAGAQVLWTTPANDPGRFWAGLRFIALPPGHRERLREWAESGTAPRP